MPIDCCTCRYRQVGCKEPCLTCAVKTPIWGNGVKWKPIPKKEAK